MRPPVDRYTGASDLMRGLLEQIEADTSVRFPSARYRQDPVAFFREILGVEPWSKQVEIIEAVRDHPRVSVKSGHKVSKSHSAAGIALWFYCSYDDARVVMTSTTSRQVDQILWRELKMMRARAGRCVACKLADPDGRRILRPCPHSALIVEEPGELARTGLKSDDFREIVGFTAREAEAVAGVSGKNLLYIADEASGIPQAIFEAIEGNRAGGARILKLGNPTKTTGEFFDDFNSKSRFCHGITVSSEETPNVIARREIIPGLATFEWVEEKKEEWGVDSPLYKVRVKGEFAVNEDGKIFPIHAIAEAERRWHETSESGRLYIGLDPAGASGLGDETVFSLRRGLKQIALYAFRGLSDETHLVHTLSLIDKHRLPRETPVVVVDREGPIGSSLAGLMRQHIGTRKGSFELVAVRASDRAFRKPQVYDRVRDQLAAGLEAWLREGGAILEDARQAAEMHELEWEQQVNGRLKVTPKDVLKKKLGRSPDRYDALALSVFEPLDHGDDEDDSETDDEDATSDGVVDPYAGTIDPYGAT